MRERIMAERLGTNRLQRLSGAHDYKSNLGNGRQRKHNFSQRGFGIATQRSHHLQQADRNGGHRRGLLWKTRMLGRIYGERHHRVSDSIHAKLRHDNVAWVGSGSEIRKRTIDCGGFVRFLRRRNFLDRLGHGNGLHQLHRRNRKQRHGPDFGLPQLLFGNFPGQRGSNQLSGLPGAHYKLGFCKHRRKPGDGQRIA